MTEPQRNRFYFPAWNDCCAANYWREIKGRLEIDDSRLNPWGCRVVAVARQRAAAEHRAMTLRDLRHACHFVALGRDIETNRLTSKQLNRIVPLFRLVQDEKNLDALMAWLNPEISERASLVAFVRKNAPEAYICTITRTKHGTVHWEDLEIPILRKLARDLAHREPTWPEDPAAARRKPPVPAPDETLDPENVPF